MNTYVYGDVILIENFIMNCLILWVTAKFSRQRASKLKIIIAALLGAVYALMSCFPQYKYLYTFMMKIIFSLLIVIIAYTPGHLKEFGKITATFYVVSFIFGGAAFGLFYFVNGLKSERNGVFYMADFPIKTLIVSAIIAYIIVRYSWDFIQYRIKRERVITKMHITLNDKNISVTSLIDTGNSLSDPISQLPVVVAEYGAIKDLLPLDIQKIFEENKQDNLNVIAKIMSQSDWVTRFRVIPFKSLGQENGMLIGFKPDAIHVLEEDEKKNIKDIIIGIYNRKLSSDGEYSALIHPDILGQ